MAARNAALTTYELLEQIISYLPTQRITIVRSVSKDWLQVVDKSIIVAKARCVHPVACSDVLPFDDAECQAHAQYCLEKAGVVSHGMRRFFVSLPPPPLVPIEDKQLLNLPYYDKNMNLRLNPAANLVRASRGEEMLKLWIPRPGLICEWEDQKEEFVTRPPCYAVALLHLDDYRGRNTIVVKEATGVKVKDLFAAHQKLLVGRQTFGRQSVYFAALMPEVDVSCLRLVHYGPAIW